MKCRNEILHFVDPVSQFSLSRDNDKLKCMKTGRIYPIIDNIPRFCSPENYTDSFGYQWNTFDKTQLDVFSGAKLSEERFYGETLWSPDVLSNLNVLEVGSGAGRFSEVFLRTTKGILYSIDYSSAVDANRKNNNCYAERLILAQASIYEIPFADNSFDKVFCLGVLQHTPSFEESVKSIIKKTKINGEIVIDFYPIKGWWTKLHAKYLLRPITKRLPKNMLLKFIRLNINWMLKLFDLMVSFRLGVLTRFIPITDVRGFPVELTNEQRKEWAILDTFDAYSPTFDNPQRLKDVESMFTKYGCEVTFAGFVKCAGGTSTVVRALKRSIS